MAKITITEALAEIKLIDKKVTSKIAFISGNLSRVAHMPDALGDSKDALTREVQAINDLQSRVVKIRSAIAQANLDTSITVNERTKSVYDWLTWKREVSEKELGLYKSIYNGVKAGMDAAANRPQIYKDDQGNTHLVQMVFSLDYPEYVKKAELLQDLLEKLDGQLSLKNATVVIDV